MSSLHGERLAGQYETADKVEARFDLYGPEFARPFIDMNQEIIDSLNLMGDETLGERGASRLRFLRMLREEYGHEGLLVAIEPYVGQLTNSKAMTEWLAGESASGKTFFVQGRAEATPLAPGSLDVLLDLNMMYHLNEAGQQSALVQAAELICPPGAKDETGGRYVIATSGALNKLQHRQFESVMGRLLGIEAPPYMNEAFDGVKAALVLPQFFPYVYEFRQFSEMVINTPWHLEKYLRSMRSLWDLYNPAIPKDSEEAKEAEGTIRQRIASEMAINGEFTDIIVRHFFICAKRSLDHLDPVKFKPL